MGGGIWKRVEFFEAQTCIPSGVVVWFLSVSLRFYFLSIPFFPGKWCHVINWKSVCIWGLD